MWYVDLDGDLTIECYDLLYPRTFAYTNSIVDASNTMIRV